MRRLRSRIGVLLAACAILMPVGPARAHHSFAMFDQAKVVTLTGTVKEFQWAAPHVLIWFIADPAGGGSETAGDGVLWTIELSTSPGPLTRLGWSKHSLAPGDRVALDINPLRSGEPGGSFKKLTILKTGQVLMTAPPDPPAGEKPTVTPAAGTAAKP